MTTQYKKCRKGHDRSSDNVDASGHCRKCRALNAAKWRDIDPQRSRDNSERYRLRNPPTEEELKRKRDYKKQYDRHYSDRSKSSVLKSKYKLTLEGRDALLSIQENKCAICDKAMNPEVRSLRPNVDHNHDTGEVRGILCHNCNIGLGNFMDNPDLLMLAATYLVVNR